MRNPGYLVLLMAICLCACKQSPEKSATFNEEKNYFPVKAWLESQLQTIDSLQLPVVQFFSANGRADTTGITMADCRKLAAPFLETDITDAGTRDKYIEKSFADQSVPSINFTYDTKDSSLPLKRVDVVLKPDPVQTDKVKSVYMEKDYSRGDTLVNEKLFWKADHYYQVITIKQMPGGQPVITKLKVAWDPTE